MEQLNCFRMKLVLVEFVAVIVLIGRSAYADFTFDEPTNLGPVVNSPYHDQLASISGDGLSLYFNSDRPGGYGSWDIWVTRRNSISEPWGEPVNLGPVVNSSDEEWSPRVSFDGLELYFRSVGIGAGDSGDIWVTTRASTDEEWGKPVNVGPPVNTPAYDTDPGGLSSDGLELYFDSKRSGSLGEVDIYVTRRQTKDAAWSEPVNLGSKLNTPNIDTYANISADGLVLFFSRVIGYGLYDLWVTTRHSTDDIWGEPLNLGLSVNTTDSECGSSISADGRTLYFSDYYYAGIRPGGNGGADLYQVSITPIIDFNGDSLVDSADMCIMIGHWGGNYNLCDIGPMPWGDGVIDVEDLKILAEHLFKDVNDPTLIAHWPLDETEGDTAYNSVSVCDGTLIGGPVWQPEGGMVAGAPQLDGIDDYVITDPVLNPADGVFSVLAWIKGDAPGQVVISQEGGANWLMTDTEGNLISELRNPGRNGSPILSQANITDGNWHRIGFVWDGLNRTLYVDGFAVAEDTQDGLEGSDNCLYIGCGKSMEAGTYWSGLIDDVRIYNRVVNP